MTGQVYLTDKVSPEVNSDSVPSLFSSNEGIDKAGSLIRAPPFCGRVGEFCDYKHNQTNNKQITKLLSNIIPAFVHSFIHSFLIKHEHTPSTF